MRKFLCLIPVASLAACGGAGPQSVGSQAAPVAPTPAGGTNTNPANNHTFVAPTVQKVYPAIGGVQSYSYTTETVQAPVVGSQTDQLYAADASTARNSGITVDYNPRDGIFDVKIEAPLALVSQTIRFQDPLHRTDFGGAEAPQTGTPRLTVNAGVQYLEAGSRTDPIVYNSPNDMLPVGDVDGSVNTFTFFYQKPGTSTKYVTFAGYVRNATSIVEDLQAGGGSRILQKNTLERAAFAYGERTANDAVPRTGTATFNGAMVASMVYNPLRDDIRSAPTYFQWIEGKSQTTVDFGANSFTLNLTGTVFAPQLDNFTSKTAVLGAGATFAASGAGRVDLVNAGGFLGEFTSVSFGQDGASMPVTIAGSSIDGAFFGPAANEVGGGFRIVGGRPDQRIDILGAFTGTK
jgi:predicted small lipoprotein YifL